ncbi:MAG: 23S rRNA (uracil(1939)-C(5))-methyltransferase RlmD [Christensenellaceae bacterium]|nr:23S rRNA (uracil(1939)-C(5))-methyltransferase RlmD [Christensenellaceae bacterium]
MSGPRILSRNDEIELTIDALGSEGQGIGRYCGMAVFVPLALVGEKVKVRIERVTNSYAEGKLLSINEEAVERVLTKCAAYPECGGCDLLHMNYDAQLEFKRTRVRDAMERIGGFKGIEVKQTLGMEVPCRYRNKASFPFAEKENVVVSGYFAKKSHRIIPVTECMIQHEISMKVLRIVTEWANRFHIQPYDERTREGILRHVVARTTAGGAMVVIVTTGKLPHSTELIEMLTNAVPEIRSIIHNVNPSNTNLILGRNNKTIFGVDTIIEKISGLKFEVSVQSFLQVNPIQTLRLYMQAIEQLNLSSNDDIIDLYCGIGTISLLMAGRVNSVLGIECVESAVSDAKRNAVLNGITNASFICGKAESLLPRLIEDGKHADALVLDPPRKGADKPALDAIIASNIPRIAYISCNPATLARDCRILADGGYGIESVQPVDMFPMTHHVETVVLMLRERTVWEK